MEAKPCAMAYPVTLVVIIPSVPAAKATVDICPMQITDTGVKEFSKICVANTWKGVSREDT